MDGLASSASIASSINRSLLSLVSSTRTTRTRTRTLSFRPRKSSVLVLSSNDNPKFDKWDQMELKFGRLLGEDPKLTLAKIMGRKLNPDVSYLEIEKLFYKKKGNSLYDDIEEVPFDVSRRELSSSSMDGLNLVRPVPEKGIKFEDEEKSKSDLKLVRPVPKKGIKSEDEKKENTAEIKKLSQSGWKGLETSKGTMPYVILRKPSKFYDDNEDTKKSSRLRIEPNLSLNMGKERNRQNFSDITLLRKPEPRSVNTNLDSKQNPTVVAKPEVIDDVEENSLTGIFVSTKATNAPKSESLESRDGSTSQEPTKLADSNIKFRADAPLQERPKRLNLSVGESTNYSAEETVCENPECNTNSIESEKFIATSTLKEPEDIDWTRAEELAKNFGKEEVELISSSTRGFVVSFGSLIGFLPYRNLSARFKFLAFESWSRRKGLDPSVYKQNLGIIGNYKVANENSLHGLNPDRDINSKIEKDILPDMKLDELLQIYDQEKIKFLSSFVGQRIRVNVILVDRKSKKLIVSMRPKEREEFIEKKRSLMAKLSIGDVVKCCITKITYFGIFVEIEGVPALIHQTEVLWDATLDPASYFKIGQTLEAKVHQLDFSLERILLSLKEITPDPLIEALECIVGVVGDRNCLDGRLEAAQADAEWADVESLVRELQNIDGIHSVSKGHFFFSPGLAPTFQVYMASMFENEYKLLARSGNKVQEVIVQASLQKEDMKSAILTCTNRVE